jgi:histone-lysine N-methyltransferase SETD3
MLLHLQRLAEAGYAKYSNTYEEDLALLQRDDLTFNNRNCVLMRSGEKEILLWWIEFVAQVLPLLDLPHKELKNAIKKAKLKKYEPYLKEILGFTVRKGG